jgi:hypothetical protein
MMDSLERAAIVVSVSADHAADDEEEAVVCWLGFWFRARGPKLSRPLIPTESYPQVYLFLLSCGCV